jgi:hypothetical protein
MLVEVWIAVKDVTKQSNNTKATKSSTNRNLSESDSFKTRSPLMNELVSKLKL